MMIIVCLLLVSEYVHCNYYNILNITMMNFLQSSFLILLNDLDTNLNYNKPTRSQHMSRAVNRNSTPQAIALNFSFELFAHQLKAL